MEYKLIVVDATRLLGSDYERAGKELSEEVNAHMAEGWQPQGGVCYALGMGRGKSYLLQALIRQNGT